MKDIRTACIIGAGNVGSHLYNWLKASDIDIVQVCSRSQKHPFIPAELIVRTPAEIKTGADIYILALRDEVLSPFLELIPHSEGLWVHTSGTLPLSILAERFPRHGVFYPLQTFSRDIEMTYSDIPILLEAGNDADYHSLSRLAASMSKRVEPLNSEQRKALHVAAVFACNFSNHMLFAAEQISESSGIPFDLLFPLLRQTLVKVIDSGPGRSQTGPALRGDRDVMLSHLAFLADLPEWQSLYESISRSIEKSHRTDE